MSNAIRKYRRRQAEAQRIKKRSRAKRFWTSFMSFLLILAMLTMIHKAYVHMVGNTSYLAG